MGFESRFFRKTHSRTEIESHIRIFLFMSSSIYNNYLKSSHWKNTRRAVLKKQRFRKNPRCFCCLNPAHKNGKGTEIHHVHYYRLKKERIEGNRDLIPVCRKCHSKIYILHRVYRISLYKCHWTLKRILRSPEMLATINRRLARTKNLSKSNELIDRKKQLIKEMTMFYDFIKK